MSKFETFCSFLIKLLKTLLYIFLALISNLIIFCFTGKEWFIFTIILILFISVPLIIIKKFNKDTNIKSDKIIEFLYLFAILLLGGSFYILKTSKSFPIIKFIETLGEKAVSALNSLSNYPDFHCNFICNSLIDNMLYIQLIIFYIIALLPLYSIFMTYKKIIILWVK